MRTAMMILLATALTARADFLVPTQATFGWDRSTGATAATSFQAWERFTSTAGPNAPQTVFGAGTGNPAAVTFGAANAFRGFGGPAGSTWPSANAAGVPTVFDANAPANGAFITGGGNIYSPGGVVQPRIIIPSNVDGVPGHLGIGSTTLLLQLRTQGTDLDLASVRVFDPVSGQDVYPAAVATLASLSLGGFGGDLFDRAFTFHVPGNADAYEFRLTAATSSLSLDRVAVDSSHSTPAPPTIVALSASTLLLAGLRRWNLRNRSEQQS